MLTEKRVIMSQKAQYAVRALLELAKRKGSAPVKAASISDAQHIPLRFLENILSELRQAGMVDSVRGKEGGYLFRGNPADVSVGETVRLIRGPMFAADCLDEKKGVSCPLRPSCVLLPLWESGHKAMMDVYDSTTFADLAESDRAARESIPINYSI